MLDSNSSSKIATGSSKLKCGSGAIGILVQLCGVAVSLADKRTIGREFESISLGVMDF